MAYIEFISSLENVIKITLKFISQYIHSCGETHSFPSGIYTSIFQKYHWNFIHLSRLLAHHWWHSSSEVNSGPPCGKSGAGHPVSKGGSSENHSGLRWVGRHGGWSGARADVCCRWCGLLPLLASRGGVCHGHGLLSDLMHNSLHEFWR